MKSNNEITMLKITRKKGQAFFIDDICVRVEDINLNKIHLLIDDKCAIVEIGNHIKIPENITITLSKNTLGQVRVRIFAPRSMPIAREEIARFDKHGKLSRVK